MARRRMIALHMVLLAFSIGCAATVESTPEGDNIDHAASALVTENALVPNALVPNALVPNALVPNALVPNALSPSALSAIQDPNLGGTLSRMFVKYAVGCAFTPSQSFSFSWTGTDSVVHQEVYYGLLGIAPTWAAGPLNTQGQEMISSCIAGRTNYYGVTVTISMRSLQSPLKTLVGSQELSAYPYVEGAFWGNLFTGNPYLGACYTKANIDHSRAALRECATGHLDTDGQAVLPCGMINIIGTCEKVCQKINGAGQYYPSCTDPTWGSTSNMVTTALP